MVQITDKNDRETILADSIEFIGEWFDRSDDDLVEWINTQFDDRRVDIWAHGDYAGALVQMFDLMAPIEAEHAWTYFERLRRMAGALLANRDDVRCQRSPQTA